MNDKLKLLALAASGPVSDDWESTGVVVCRPAEGGMEYLVETCAPFANRDSDAILEYIAAANPKTILHLIAENEAMRIKLTDLEQTRIVYYTLAAHVGIGMQDTPKLADAYSVWDAGGYELVFATMQYVEYMQTIYDVVQRTGVNIPGVFDYEVAEYFGSWMANEIAQAKEPATLPPHDECCAHIRELSLAFFCRRRVPPVNDEIALIQRTINSVAIPPSPVW